MRQLPSWFAMLLLLILSFVSADARADCVQPSPYARLSLINLCGELPELPTKAPALSYVLLS